MAENKPGLADQVASKFDVNTLTIGEVATIEDLSGFAIDALSDKGTPKGKLLAAIVYTIKHRTDPKYTFPMALTVPIAEIDSLIGDDAEEKPAGAPEA